MPQLRYSDIVRRVRKDPLGPITLNTMRANAQSLDFLAAAGHAADGTHNTLAVARTLGRIIRSGTYSTGSFNSRFSSLANPAVGSLTITLAAGQFTFPNMLTLAAPLADGDVKPCIATCSLSNATTVLVYLKKMTSALGAGNVWAAYDGNLSLAVHSTPLTVTDPFTASNQWYQRDPLHDQATGWNALATNVGKLRKNLLVEHASSGAHNAVEICRDIGWCTWNGTSYSVTGGTFPSVSRVSAGVVDVTMRYTYASTTTMLAFPEVAATSNTSLWVINPLPQSTTVCRFYLFQYSGGVWNLADQNFFAAVYGS